MKVKELINILSRTEKVLKLYEDKTVDEMIEDIYLKLHSTNVENKLLSKSNNTKNEMSASNATMDEVSYKKIIDEIKDKEKQEIVAYMKKLKKDDFMHIAKLLNIKINKSSKKDIMIESIASYFSFINLNQKVNERDNEKLQKFLNLNS